MVELLPLEPDESTVRRERRESWDVLDLLEPYTRLCRVFT